MQETHINLNSESIKDCSTVDLLREMYGVLAKNICKLGPISRIVVYDSEESMRKEGVMGFNKNNFQATIYYGEE